MHLKKDLDRKSQERQEIDRILILFITVFITTDDGFLLRAILDDSSEKLVYLDTVTTLMSYIIKQ